MCIFVARAYRSVAFRERWGGEEFTHRNITEGIALRTIDKQYERWISYGYKAESDIRLLQVVFIHKNMKTFVIFILSI